MSIFGYEFKNPALLAEALVTPSRKMSEPGVRDNQRLEFLGDAVLGLLAADRLYRESPQSEEGELTVMRTHMVSATALCEAAAGFDFVSKLKRNDHATALPSNSKTIADAIEAVIGAAWLDGGLDAARTVFDALDLKSEIAEGSALGNPKGDLQILSQSMKPARLPVYQIVNSGIANGEPFFTVQVTVEGIGSAEATAHNRKSAETLAAAKLLDSARS